MEVHELTDGGQTAEEMAGAGRRVHRAAASDARARALRHPPARAGRGHRRRRAARGRRPRRRRAAALQRRLSRPPAIQPPPSTRPELLHELPIEDRAVPGIPDLMHHKYVVRDATAVWTGSANWTADSWTRQENVRRRSSSRAALAGRLSPRTSRSCGSAATSSAQRPGRARRRSTSEAGGPARPGSPPGTGPQLSQAIATAIGCAPAAGADRLAGDHLGADPRDPGRARRRGGVDIAGVIDEPQTDAVYGQWATNGTSAWKIPLLAKTLSLLPFSGKRSTPWGPGTVHDFMHAKVTVADDTVFVGSFNLSRSGEMNAENVLEIHDPGAGRPDGGVRRRGARRATRRRRCPRRRWRRSPPGRRQTVGISKSARGDPARRRAARARTQSSSPDQ